MRFYDYPAAPSPRKVRLFAAEKGIHLPTVEVDLRASAHLAPEFLRKNPSGTVPVLELDDGTCIAESLAICHYLEQVQPEPNLLGRDAKEQALVLMWVERQTFEGFLSLADALRNAHPAFKDRAIVGPVGFEQIPALAERGKRRAALYLDALEARLGESPFVAGERYTYADIVGFVHVDFARLALKGVDAFAARPALRRWHDAVASRPAVQRPA